MTVKKDLTDIGYLLITPNVKKFRFEGVNYRRASIQLIVGTVALNVAVGAVALYGPVICEKVDDVKNNIKRRYYAHKK